MNLGEFHYKNGLELLGKAIRKAADSERCNMCLILIPKELRTQYKKIKDISLVKHKMICQVATELTLRKKNLHSIATKILLQIIAKRGNILWVPKLQSDIEGAMMIAF
jgi:argonaute-like protein implicated in RNA metabolism and viral defense